MIYSHLIKQKQNETIVSDQVSFFLEKICKY